MLLQRSRVVNPMFHSLLVGLLSTLPLLPPFLFHLFSAAEESEIMDALFVGIQSLLPDAHGEACLDSPDLSLPALQDDLAIRPKKRPEDNSSKSKSSKLNVS